MLRRNLAIRRARHCRTDQPRSRRYLMLLPICASSRGDSAIVSEKSNDSKRRWRGVAPRQRGNCDEQQSGHKVTGAGAGEQRRAARSQTNDCCQAADTALNAGREPHERRENAQQYVPPTTSHTELNRRVEREMPFPPLSGFLPSRPFRPF